MYNTNSDISFNSAILKSILCDYGDAYILVKARITFDGAGDNAGVRQPDGKNKINCEINFILTWSSTCFITNSTLIGNFTKTDTRLSVPVVTLSIKDNAKLLQEIKTKMLTLFRMGFSEAAHG